MVNTTHLDLALVLRHMLKSARLGREVLLRHFGRLSQVEKKHQAGLVSEADKESERVIREYLEQQFPTFEFLGEESFAAGDRPNWNPQHENPRWILDPLDGTTNYVHSFPIYCISLALEYRGQIVSSVIDVPALGETYTATLGGGARKNGNKIQVSQEASLKESLLATGFFNELEEDLKEQLGVFDRLVRKCRGVRRPGAAAFDLCMVASGVFDGYWEKNLKPWDSAAGILLVREAGGQVRTYRGMEYHPYLNSIVAGNSQIVKALISELSSCQILSSTS